MVTLMYCLFGYFLGYISYLCPLYGFIANAYSQLWLQHVPNVEIHNYVHYILGEALLYYTIIIIIYKVIIYYGNNNNCKNIVDPLELDKSRC
jgi:hypothetical protein